MSANRAFVAVPGSEGSNCNNDNGLRILLNSLRSPSGPAPTAPQSFTSPPRPQLLVPNLSFQDRLASPPVNSVNQGVDLVTPRSTCPPPPTNLVPNISHCAPPPQCQQQHLAQLVLYMPQRVDAPQHCQPGQQSGSQNHQRPPPLHQYLPSRGSMTIPGGLNPHQNAPQTSHQPHFLGQPQAISSPHNAMSPQLPPSLPGSALQPMSVVAPPPQQPSFLHPPELLVRPSQLSLPPSPLIDRDPQPVNTVEGGSFKRSLPPSLDLNPPPTTQRASPPNHMSSQQAGTSRQRQSKDRTSSQTPHLFLMPEGPSPEANSSGTNQGTISQLAMPPGLKKGPSHNSNSQDGSVAIVLNGLKGILDNIDPKKSSDTAEVGTESNCEVIKSLLNAKVKETSATAESSHKDVSDKDLCPDESMPEIKEEIIDEEEDGFDCTIVGVDFSKRTFMLHKDISGTVVDLIDESENSPGRLMEVKVEYDSDVAEHNVGAEAMISISGGAPRVLQTENEEESQVTNKHNAGNDSPASCTTATSVGTNLVGKSSNGVSSEKETSMNSGRGNDPHAGKSPPNDMAVLMKSLGGILTTIKKTADKNLSNSTDEASHDSSTSGKIPNGTSSTMTPTPDRQKPNSSMQPESMGCEILISDDDDENDKKDATGKSPNVGDILSHSQIKKEPVEIQSEKQFVPDTGGSDEVLDASTWQALKVLLNKTLSKQAVKSSEKGETDSGEKLVGNAPHDTSLNSETQTRKDEEKSKDTPDQAVTSSTNEGDNDKRGSFSDGNTISTNSSSRESGEVVKQTKKPGPKHKCGPKSYKARIETVKEAALPSRKQIPVPHASQKQSSRQSPEHLEKAAPVTKIKRKPGPKPAFKRKRKENESPTTPSKCIKFSSPQSQSNSSQLNWRHSKTSPTLKSSPPAREISPASQSNQQSLKSKQRSKPIDLIHPPLPSSKTLGQPEAEKTAKAVKVPDSSIPPPPKNMNNVVPSSVSNLHIETKSAEQIQSSVTSSASSQISDRKSPASTSSCNETVEDPDSDSSVSDDDNESLCSSDSSGEEADLEYRCKLCNKSFHKKSQFKKHMAVHYGGEVGSKPVKRIHCKACRRKFVDKTALQAHLLQRKYCFFDCTRFFWKKKSGSVDLCKMCGKGTANWKDMKRHCYKNLTCRLRYIDKILESINLQQKGHKDKQTASEASGNEQPSSSSHEGTDISEPILSLKEQAPTTSQKNTSQDDPSGNDITSQPKHAVGPHLCKCCQEMFDTPTNFRKHLNKKSLCKEFNLKPNNCSLDLNYCHKCDISMPSASKLLTHVCLGKAFTVKCPTCSNRFSNSFGLKLHLRLSTCGKFEKSSCSSESKRPTDNKNEKDQNDSTLVSTHTSHTSHTSVGEKQIVCLLCQKVCVALSDLLEHSHSHTEEDQFQCSQCQMIFNRYNGLVSHEIWHKRKLDLMPSTSTSSPQVPKPVVTPEPGRKDHTCFECNLTFDAPEDLKFHILTHKPWDGTRYGCPICPLKYDKLSLFNNHVAHHKKVLEKRVSKQSKPAKTRKLVKNIKTESNETFFACSACGQQFPTLSGRYDHLETSEACRAVKSVWGRKQKPIETGSHLPRLKNKGAPNLSKCTLCSLTLRKASFKKHLQVHLQRISKSVKDKSHAASNNASAEASCPICERRFFPRGLLCHLPRHKPVDIMKQLNKNSRVKVADIKKSDELASGSISQLRSPASKSKIAKKIGRVSYFFSCKICNKKVNSIPAFKFHLKIAHKYKSCEGWSEFVNYLQSDSEASQESSSIEKTSMKTATPVKLRKTERVTCEICKNSFSKFYFRRHISRVHGLDPSLFFSRRVKAKTASSNCISPSSKTDGAASAQPASTAGVPLEKILPLPCNDSDGCEDKVTSTSSASDCKECPVCRAVFPSSGKLWRHQFEHISPCSVTVSPLVLYCAGPTISPT